MRTWIALAGAAVLLCGCHFSKLDANAAVHVSGRALDATGAPLAHVQVRLFKEADIGETLIGTVLAIGSLGSICLLPEAPAICRQARTATTGADGSYAFDLKGSDTQGTVGSEATLDVVVADPRAGADGPSTTLTFKARGTSVTLPDARLWNAAPRLAQQGGRISMSWSPLTATYGAKAAYSAQLFTSNRQAALWSQSASAGHADIDARVVEDHPAAAAVAAHTKIGGASDVRANYLSSRLAVRPTAGAPPSRGHACSAVAGTTRPAAVRQPRCAVTDGDLVTPARLNAPNAQVVSGVIVDLGTARPVDLVVARGLAGMFVVEVSEDGNTYRTTGTASDSSAALSPPGRPVARYVRVRSPSGLDESLLTEVSVW